MLNKKVFNNYLHFVYKVKLMVICFTVFEYCVLFICNYKKLNKNSLAKIGLSILICKFVF